MPHTRRPRFSPHRPHHVTVRVTRGTWNLRSQRCFAPVRAALERAAKRAGFRITHFSVQHDHIHMIVEADDQRTMSDGLRALFSRIARDLNAVMKTHGPRFDDRYHQHILATPTEVRNPSDREELDPFSSLAQPVVKRPRSWLLREGWTRARP